MDLLFLMVILLSASASSGYAARRSWRDPGFNGTQMPMIRILPLSSTGKLRLGTAIAPLFAAYLSLLIFAAIGCIRSIWNIPGDSAFRVLGGALLVIFAGSVLAIAGVIISGRPRFLIPPPCRKW